MDPAEPSNSEIELMVLAILKDSPLYGYAIAKRLSAASGGVVALSPGVLYPLLRSLEKAGLISATWEEVKASRSAEDSGGRKRKWYQLTARGRKRLEHRIEAHRAHQRMIERFVQGVFPDSAANGARA